ncbi:MAG: amidohydrolase family protein [Acidimicrobiales bacterium]
MVAAVLFPNTQPPFAPPAATSFEAPPYSDNFEHRWAGLKAHNRWLADYCSRKPEARAGIGQIFLNDVDDAIADVQWCAENGLRGGVLIGSVPPTCDWLKPLYHPDYDPLWAACEELGVVVNTHSGTGSPDYVPAPAMPMVHILEMIFYAQRPLAYLILGGVFERFPKLQMALTEAGCAWVPGVLTHLDSVIGMIKAKGTGEMRFEGDAAPELSATEYFQRNCHIGMSQPLPADIRAAVGDVGLDRVMWGSDYPHEEGTHPFTREHMRQVLGHLPPADIQQILAGNAAELYGFDLEALRPAADKYGPTVAEIAEPLEALPEGANETLRRAARQLAGR